MLQYLVVSKMYWDSLEKKKSETNFVRDEIYLIKDLMKNDLSHL